MNKLFRIFFVSLFTFTLFLSTAFAGEPEQNNNKVRIDYYWGIGCHFCEKVKPFLEDVKSKYDDKIDFREHEVFQNEHNFLVFQQVMKIYRFDPNNIGTPTLIINGNVLS